MRTETRMRIGSSRESKRMEIRISATRLMKLDILKSISAGEATPTASVGLRTEKNWMARNIVRPAPRTAMA